MTVFDTMVTLTNKNEKTESFISDQLANSIIKADKWISIQDSNFRSNLKESKMGGNLVATIPLECEYNCVIKIRQNIDRPTNFSIILLFKTGSVLVPIIRYNGNHGKHENTKTGEVFTGPHIHKITEWYQLNTSHPDGEATKTDEYETLDGAVKIFKRDMHIMVKRANGQMELGKWVEMK